MGAGAGVGAGAAGEDSTWAGAGSVFASCRAAGERKCMARPTTAATTPTVPAIRMGPLLLLRATGAGAPRDAFSCTATETTGDDAGWAATGAAATEAADFATGKGAAVLRGRAANVSRVDCTQAASEEPAEATCSKPAEPALTRLGSISRERRPASAAAEGDHAFTPSSFATWATSQAWLGTRPTTWRWVTGCAPRTPFSWAATGSAIFGPASEKS